MKAYSVSRLAAIGPPPHRFASRILLMLSPMGSRRTSRSSNAASDFAAGQRKHECCWPASSEKSPRFLSQLDLRLFDKLHRFRCKMADTILRQIHSS